MFPSPRDLHEMGCCHLADDSLLHENLKESGLRHLGRVAVKRPVGTGGGGGEGRGGVVFTTLRN